MELNKRRINVGICGLGTVGGGALEVLARNRDIIGARALDIQITHVADKDSSRAASLLQKLGLQNIKVSSSWQELVSDPMIDIVVELIGAAPAACELISAALKAGKSVVTANKDIMAAHGGELLDMAEQNGADLFFEGSVCGGIPIIQAMKEGFVANRISQLIGIVNGTTNYILTNMTEQGTSFAEALSEARRLGYAEPDPRNDIEGYDAARKIAILASIAFNSRVSDDMVPTEGMSGLSQWDIAYAGEFGYVIKMLAIARSDGNSIEARVHPAMIKKSHPLAAVRDSYNAVFVEGDALEKAMMYGRGAGALPTGSAVAGDIVSAARNIAYNNRGHRGCTCYRRLPVKTLAQTFSKYYVRMQAQDMPGVFAAITAKLGEQQVSMASVVQKRGVEGNVAEIVLITHLVNHEHMQCALNEIAALDCVAEIGSVIRVEDSE
ncbi:MAG: homoserine dehydrogenase [Clostridiales bacterium]|nr:homoserine dehydrogenase [Clostridiales bacterium]